MHITTTTRPPVPGTTTVVSWEGYIRADEMLIGDEIIPSGEVTSLRHRLDGTVYVSGTRFAAIYEADEMLYIERTVRVTVAEA